jgi:hypothetical protein
VQLVQGQKWLVTSVSSRLCAWEFDLANEALAKRACCTRCGGRALTQVTRIEAEKRSVQYWCAGCAGFRSYRVSVEEYASIFSCTDGIPRAPMGWKVCWAPSQQTIGNSCLSRNRDVGPQGRTCCPLSYCDAQAA